MSTLCQAPVKFSAEMFEAAARTGYDTSMAGIASISGSSPAPGSPGADPTRALATGFGLPPAATGTATSQFEPPAFRGQFYSIYQPDLAIASAVSSAGIKAQPPGPLLDITASKSAPAPLPGFGQTADQTQTADQSNQQARQDTGAADSTRIKLFSSLANIHERIAFANASGDTAAAEQLRVGETSVNGQIQGQTFAGIGTTPPQPFAKPEIPPIYLNTAA